MSRLRKYGVEATIDFEVYEVDGVDLRADWVPAQADCEIMKDGGASTLCDNTATDEGSTYSIVLTATEMQAARLVLKVVDAATKAFLDKVVIIETYGNASAQHAMDFDDDSVRADWVDGGRLDLLLDGASTHDAAAVLAAIQAAGTHLTLIKAVTDLLPDAGALTTIAADAARLTAARAAVLTDWIDAGRLDAILDAIKAVTDAMPDSGALTTIGADAARLTAARAGALTDWIDGGRLDLLLDAVKAITDAIPDSGALSAIGTDTARLTGVRAAVLTDWINGGRLDLLLDAIKVVTDALTSAAATKLAASAGQIIQATVDTVVNTHTPTTTEFQADDVTEATTDHYKGRIVIFTSGALVGQATDITGYAKVTTIGQFTVTAMTEAPANDDTFVIV